MPLTLPVCAYQDRNLVVATLYNSARLGAANTRSWTSGGGRLSLAGDASCPARRLDSTEFVTMILYLYRDGVFAPAAAPASSSTCSTRATSTTSSRTCSTAACVFATYSCAVLSMFAMDTSMAGLVMAVGTGSVPLRSPRACVVRAYACFRTAHDFWLLWARPRSSWTWA